MTTSEILRLKSLDRLEDVRKADERNEMIKRKFRLAGRALDLAWDKRTAAEKEVPNRADFHRRQLNKARQSAAVHAAAAALDASKEKLRQERARAWNQVESVLVEERRRRVNKAAIAIQKAVETNQRIHEMDCKIDKLAPPGTGRRGSLIFGVGWQELNRERFEDWLRFLKTTGVLDEPDLAVVRSKRETIWGNSPPGM